MAILRSGICAAAIAAGRRSLWSMRCNRGGAARRAVTVELNNASRTIVQCPGRGHRFPRPEERRVLELWAQENGLRVGA